MATAIATGIGMGVGVGAGYSLLSDYLNTGITYAKWKTLGRSGAYPIMADILQKVIDAEKDPNTGLSSAGMVDTMFKFIDRTLDLSWYLDRSMAQSMFMHMIQQSIAYAVHSSHGGAVQSICNVYSGSAPLLGINISKLAQNADLFDRKTKALIGAESGQNIPSTAFETIIGANTRIDNAYKRIMQNVDKLTDEWNTVALSYYSHYHTMAKQRLQEALEMKESIVAKAYAFLEKVANTHLTRISEQLDTLTGTNAWYVSNLVSADEMSQIALRVDIERKASESNFNDYVSEITSSINASLTEWNTKITQALTDMHDCEARYADMIYTLFESLFSDVNDFVTALCDEADKQIEDVCAYRNVPQNIHVSVETEIGTFEMSPETEIFRLRWRKVEYCTPMGIREEIIAPRSLKWSYMDITIIKESAIPLIQSNLVVMPHSVVVLEHKNLNESSWAYEGGC
jgi:multidrug transporter EmrE-like cation transporter